MATGRRIGIRFNFEVEVYVHSAWIESNTMGQIELQARKDAEREIRNLLSEHPNIQLVGELGYRLTLAEERKDR